VNAGVRVLIFNGEADACAYSRDCAVETPSGPLRPCTMPRDHHTYGFLHLPRFGAGVPYNDNERWTSSMGYTVIKPWTSWMAQEDWVSRHASASATTAMPLSPVSACTVECLQRVGCPLAAMSTILFSYVPFHVPFSSQVGGYVTQYANNFTFATVRGAGHMVSEVQPMAAWSLFDRFINQKPW